MRRRGSATATIGLCGAGTHAAVHALAAHLAGLHVGPIASRSIDRAEELAAHVGGHAVRYDEVASQADLVVITTPPHTHLEHAFAALDDGAAVAIEAPLTETLADADALVAHRLADRIGYAEHLAHAPVVEALLARRRTIGPPSFIEVRLLQGRPAAPSNGRPARRGGALAELGSHALGVVLLVAMPARPVAVRAGLDWSDDLGTDERGVMHIEFAGGLSARIEASWCDGPDPTWDVQVASATGVLRADLLPIVGLEHDGTPVALPGRNDDATPLEQLGFTRQLTSLCEDWAAPRRPLIDVAFGRLVVEMMCAAYCSARLDGEPVTVPFAGRRDRSPWQHWQEG